MLCDRLDDMWGERYKIAVANMKGRQDPYVMEDSRKEEIVIGLLPKASRFEWAARIEEVDIESFFDEEVARAIESLISGKAPSGDGV